MKIVYCLAGTYNSGGMERIVTAKANYLAESGHEITIVTTEQEGRQPFFPLDANIQTHDLAINYAHDTGKNFVLKSISFMLKRRRHRKLLAAYLKSISPDVVISTFGTEATFLCDITDGSKKVLEIHFSKFFRLQYARKGIWRWVDNWRSKWDERIVRKFDHFVVLTHEDKEHWAATPNITVIPNFISSIPPRQSSVENKVCLAVGRLSYQKGFDRLIMAWKTVHEQYPDWKLQIYGSGELQEVLLLMISNLGLQECVTIHPPTKRIGEVYEQASLFLLSSHYEGLPMVMLEALSYGLPVVSFACKCGPKDLIRDGLNGYLLSDGDIIGFAGKVMRLISNEEMRQRMGYNAYKLVLQEYTKEKIMNKWIFLFHNL